MAIKKVGSPAPKPISEKESPKKETPKTETTEASTKEAPKASSIRSKIKAAPAAKAPARASTSATGTVHPLIIVKKDPSVSGGLRKVFIKTKQLYCYHNEDTDSHKDVYVHRIDKNKGLAEVSFFQEHGKKNAEGKFVIPVDTLDEPLRPDVNTRFDYLRLVATEVLRDVPTITEPLYLAKVVWESPIP